MSLISIEEVLARAALGTRAQSAVGVLAEATKEYAPSRTYDIFLSHSFQDAEVILGIKLTIEDLGYSVYVDWVEDSEFDRQEVTAAVAERLKVRMKNSKSLFFAASDESPNSKWMPWELGFFDGLKAKVAILPLTKKKSSGNSYRGQEYLGIYPYATRDTEGTLWIHEAPLVYVKFSSWLRGAKPAPANPPW